MCLSGRQNFCRRIGKAAHAIDFQFGAMAFPDIERKTSASEKQRWSGGGSK
jgi:hypothetical protein